MSLKDTPLGTPEKFNVVVEIPKGSPTKFEYDEAKDQIVSDFEFRDGLLFINNYGFIPQTKADDNDPVDVMILGHNPIPSGTIVSCRPIGLIKMLDRGQGDDKVLAVAVDSNEPYQDIADFSEEERQKVIAFYMEVGRQKQKLIQILGFEDRQQAIEAIKRAML